MNHPLALFCVLLLGLLGSCTSASFSELDPLPLQPTEVQVRIDSDILDPDYLAEMRKLLTGAIMIHGDPVELVANADIVLEGRITEHEQGNQFLRWLLWPLAGRGHLQTTWVAHKASGERLGSCTIDAVITGGVFGGQFEAAVPLETGRRVGDFLRSARPR